MVAEVHNSALLCQSTDSMLHFSVWLSTSVRDNVPYERKKSNKASHFSLLGILHRFRPSNHMFRVAVVMLCLMVSAQPTAYIFLAMSASYLTNLTTSNSSFSSPDSNAALRGTILIPWRLPGLFLSHSSVSSSEGGGPCRRLFRILTLAWMARISESVEVRIRCSQAVRHPIGRLSHSSNSSVVRVMGTLV